MNRWRETGSELVALNLATAIRIAGQFIGFATRRLKGLDQDRDADRTLTRHDAAWLGAMILEGQPKDFPPLVPRAGKLPSQEAWSVMPHEAARQILYGIGADETMRRCHARIYASTRGPRRQLLTLAEVERKRVGDPAKGGDERYERRLRSRAGKDELAAALAEELDHALRELNQRTSRGREFPQ